MGVLSRQVPSLIAVSIAVSLYRLGSNADVLGQPRRTPVRKDGLSSWFVRLNIRQTSFACRSRRFAKRGADRKAPKVFSIKQAEEALVDNPTPATKKIPSSTDGGIFIEMSFILLCGVAACLQAHAYSYR